MLNKEGISQSLFINLKSNLSGMFYTCLNDDNRTFEFVSEGCEALTGYKPEELLQKTPISFSSFIHFEDQDWLKHKSSDNLAKKLNNYFKYRIITKSGTIKWVNEISNGIYNAKGELIKIEGYISDIAPNQGVSTISKVFNSLQNAINSTSIVSITNVNGEIIYANELFCHISKYSLSELVGQDHRIINSGQHPKSFFTDLWKTITVGNMWRGEICNRAKDGSLYWVDTVITPVFGNDKKIEQYLSIRNLITDKKNAEYALIKSEVRFRKVFATVNDVIYTISKEGTFVTLNQAFEKITGWKIEKWIGQPFVNLIHPEDINMAVNAFHSTFRGENVDPYELRIKIKSGKYVYTEVTPSVLIENGVIASTLGIARDISFRKETELKIKRIYDTISVKTGMNYFTNLTKYCCDNLNVKYACIGLYLPGQEAIQTLSFRSKNQVLENYTYPIKNTASEKVVKMEGFLFLENAQKRFPKDKELKTFGIESYMGYPLLDENQEVLGLIILMDDKPITDAVEKENILSFLLARTANEISRNSAEQKLKESEEFNKGVLASLTSHIAVLNKNGDIISTNDAWNNFALNNGETTLSRTGIGSNYFEVCKKAIKEGDEIVIKTVKGIKAVLNEEIKTFQIEYPCNSKNKERWFILSVSKYESRDPKVVVRHIDITERRKVENRLEKSEKNYRDLIENSQDIIFSLDSTGKFIFTNKYCQTLLKYPPEEFHKLELFNIIDEDYRNECLKHLKEVLNGKKNHNIETVFVTKKKKKIFVEGNSTPIIVDGEVVGIQSFFRDITERKKTELELIRSEHRYKNVVENINDAIIIRNLKGRITFANQRFLDLLGYKKEDLIGLSMEDYIAIGWRAEIIKQYNTIINSDKISEVYEYQALHNDGTTRWFEDKINLLHENGKIIGTQAVIRDITELKKKENELTKLITELTNRNNEMMQFNYIVSHNLRAPIANIIGLSNLINTENVAQKEGKIILEHIKNSSVKMDEMIKDLSIVLNTRSNLNAKKEKILLHSIIHSISETLEDQISKSKCKINVDIHPNANAMFTIKSYIESILFNLISNAIKYRSSERTLLLNIIARKDSNGTVITISDNGIGINLEENGAYIFGLYKRFNYEVEGKGLGLHMTKAQVEALGGKITIDSVLDKGTTFKITFNN